MSNLQIIEELLRIAEMQNAIIRKQSTLLAEFGAVVMEEEIENANLALRHFLGHDETPDDVGKLSSVD